MNKYEHRRKKLLELKDEFCHGKISELAEKLGRSDSYVSRMLYPEGKVGKKRIGDDMVDVIAQTFNVPKSWLDGSNANVQIGNHFGDNAQITGQNDFRVSQQNCPHPTEQARTHDDIMPDQSLAPVIPQGSELWLDTQQTEIQDGKIYRVEYGGAKWFRRLFRLTENRVRLAVFDNKNEFPEHDVSGEALKVLGQVKAWKVTEQ